MGFALDAHVTMIGAIYNAHIQSPSMCWMPTSVNALTALTMMYFSKLNTYPTYGDKSEPG